MNTANDRDEMGRSVLHYAAAHGDQAAVRTAVNAGSDVNAVDTGGWTPLHFAAQAQAASVIAVLLDAGADPHRSDRHGNTPLWRAVFNYRDDPATVQALLAAGADPDHKNHHGVSARDLAARIATSDIANHIPSKPGVSALDSGPGQEPV